MSAQNLSTKKMEGSSSKESYQKMVEDSNKLKILCLHGYKKHGDLFIRKIFPFRKVIAKYAKVVFLAAPHIVTDEEDEYCFPESRSWWFHTENSSDGSGPKALGFKESMEMIEYTVENKGPFDGFMGFSQGACLVGLLAAMQQKGHLPFSFRFAILVSGFRSGSPLHKAYYEDMINLSSLHIYGDSDYYIPKEMSERLKNMFANPVVAEHSKAYLASCKGTIKQAYFSFVKDIFQNIMATEEPIR